MAEHRPYTKAERKDIVQLAANECLLYGDNHVERHKVAHQMLRYDATIQDRDRQNAALRAEITRLRPDAATGAAVGQMVVGGVLWRVRDDTWYSCSPAQDNYIQKVEAATALAALTATKEDDHV